MATVRIRFTVNGATRQYTGDGAQPLLWVLRDAWGLPGTKYGCGIGACGACTVHVDGQAARACVVPVGTLAGRAVRTVEGLAASDGRLHPVQQAWMEHDVPQCGYCQAGQMMACAALLQHQPRPSEADIDAAMRGNLCRCGTYARIRRAVHRAAELHAQAGAATRRDARPQARSDATPVATAKEMGDQPAAAVRPATQDA